jgi:ABC-2 type transport system ATP-binding protein
MMKVLEVQSVSKSYSNHIALDDVSLSVEEGQIFGLLGPNGAGKTSLIRIINQITMPDKGTVFFNGDKLNHAHVAQIGYLPEERGLYKQMKVGEQALYLAQLKGLSEKQAKKALKIWFESLTSLHGGIKKWRNFLKEWHRKFNLLQPFYTNLNC